MPGILPETQTGWQDQGPPLSGHEVDRSAVGLARTSSRRPLLSFLAVGLDGRRDCVLGVPFTPTHLQGRATSRKCFVHNQGRIIHHFFI